jgi:hypothetical protein
VAASTSTIVSIRDVIPGTPASGVWPQPPAASREPISSGGERHRDTEDSAKAGRHGKSATAIAIRVSALPGSLRRRTGVPARDEILEPFAGDSRLRQVRPAALREG